MIHKCFISSEEKPKSGQDFLSAGNRGVRRDGFTEMPRSGAGVRRRGSARRGLPGCGAPRLPAGPPARQAEETPGLPPWPISHPCHRKHFLPRHRAARLPQEAKRSSRTGKRDSGRAHRRGFFGGRGGGGGGDQEGGCKLSARRCCWGTLQWKEGNNRKLVFVGETQLLIGREKLTNQKTVRNESLLQRTLIISCKQCCVKVLYQHFFSLLIGLLISLIHKQNIKP